MKKALEAIRFSGAGLFFAGAALLALLTGFSIYGYLKSAVPTATVYVTVRDLPPGTTITVRDVATQRVSDAAVPDGAVQNKEALVGRRIRYGLVTGDMVRDRHLVPQGSSDVARAVADQGEEYRAVMIPGDLVPAIDRLVPGDKLELTGVLPVRDSATNSSVAVHLGFATVLDVHLSKSSNDKSTVLVTLRAAEVSRLALTLRAGSLMVAVQGTDQQPGETAPLRLEALTGIGM